MSDSMTLVDLHSVSVHSGSVRILENITISVSSGQAVGVFGANGAGKTTLLRLIATLQPPSSGSGSVLDFDLNSSGRYDIRHRIGYIGHEPGLYRELTLLENLTFVAEARGLEPSAALQSLEMVGLGGAVNRRAEHTSHGMQRRAEFARILMTKPDLLLLDEPHSALDSDAVKLVDDLVLRTLDSGGAAVLVSHEKDRVNKLVDTSYELSGGTLL